MAFKDPISFPLAIGNHVIAIRNAAQNGDVKTLGVRSAEALDSIRQSLDPVINYLNSPAETEKGAQTPIFIYDPQHHLVGVLGYQVVGQSANYGLTTYDLLGNLLNWVGVQIEVPLQVTAATNTSPTVLTVPGNNYHNNDMLYITGETSNTNINGERIATNVNHGAGTFQITDLSGTLINGNGAYSGSAICSRFFGGAEFVSDGVTIAINNSQPTGGTATAPGVGVVSTASATANTQTTTAAGFVVVINSNLHPCASFAVLDPTNPNSAGILRVFDGTGTGSLGSGQVLIYDGNALLGQVIGTWKVQNAGGTFYGQLTAGAVNGVDVDGAWGLASATGLQISGNTVVNNLTDGFLRSLKIGAVQAIDASDNALFADVTASTYHAGAAAGVDKSGGFEITGYSTTTLTSGSDAGTVVVTGITTRAQAFTKGLRTT